MIGPLINRGASCMLPADLRLAVSLLVRRHPPGAHLLWPARAVAALMQNITLGTVIVATPARDVINAARGAAATMTAQSKVAERHYIVKVR